MNYKEKYEQALERARHYYLTGKGEPVDFIKMIFPELKESEDEKIRKEIINFITSSNKYGTNERCEAWLNWLEGQSEERPVDKVESKFHEGDWVIHDYNILKIKCVGNTHYCFETVSGYVDDMLVSEIDSQFHLWTIQDAKDGDLLVDKDNNIGLYSGERGVVYWHSYIYLGCDGCLRGGGGYHKHKNTKPATKEQRDLFFEKIKQEGYEWNAEKKEVKKIEDKTLETRGNQVTSEIIKNQKEIPGEFTKLVHKKFWDLINTGHKMLVADKVIEWLDSNICNAYDYDGNDISTTLKSKFKQYFGLC